MMEEIRLNDPRLTRPERQVLRTIALRTKGPLARPEDQSVELIRAVGSKWQDDNGGQLSSEMQ
jgi:hypothetical protein